MKILQTIKNIIKEIKQFERKSIILAELMKQKKYLETKELHKIKFQKVNDEEMVQKTTEYINTTRETIKPLEDDLKLNFNEEITNIVQQEKACRQQLYQMNTIKDQFDLNIKEQQFKLQFINSKIDQIQNITKLS